jgi:hypothetical protein
MNTDWNAKQGESNAQGPASDVLITEKQDKALRSLIDEAEKPERFESREKSA